MPQVPRHSIKSDFRKKPRALITQESEESQSRCQELHERTAINNNYPGVDRWSLMGESGVPVDYTNRHDDPMHAVGTKSENWTELSKDIIKFVYSQIRKTPVP